jgi:hypothetical protein
VPAALSQRDGIYGKSIFVSISSLRICWLGSLFLVLCSVVCLDQAARLEHRSQLPRTPPLLFLTHTSQHALLNFNFPHNSRTPTPRAAPALWSKPALPLFIPLSPIHTKAALDTRRALRRRRPRWRNARFAYCR